MSNNVNNQSQIVDNESEVSSYSDEYLKEVATTIRKQLNLRITEVWAWGSNKYVYGIREVDGMKCPALEFSIKTPKIKRGGRVIISLNEGADEYIVEAIKIRKGKETIIGKKNGVFFNELHDVINSFIEDEKTYYQVQI